MLIAQNSEGKLFSLAQVSRESSGEWRKLRLFCPICDQRVRLKRGRIRIPHFAHVSDQSCLSTNTGESEEHLTLKKLLVEWCSQQGIAHQLEAYIPKIQQRADLLIGHLAIEFQCSTLTLTDMEKRTASYIKNGYQPFWICGEHIWNTGKNSKAIRRFCSYSEKLGFHLWTANWRTKKLYLRYHIELAANKMRYGTKCWSFGEERLREIMDKEFEKRLFHFREYLPEEEMSTAYQEIYKKLRGRKRDIMAVQSLYYQNGLHLLSLHPWFYYPINCGFLLNGSDLLFKYQCWDLLRGRKKQVIKKEELLAFSRDYLVKQKLDQLFPLIELPILAKWQTHYLIKGLVSCGVLKKTSEENGFQIIIDPTNTVKPHSTLFLDKKWGTEVIITGTPVKI
ncbi:competence protein CoiA [Candidatus Enterococcus clewellii]|uniref:Competence protein CoiA n=1 Tax=Candidatus Enterococcus clewellii TaxID=1834193 RepID=A0A242K6B3_9ENTE|nr:competence protein CoiA family protein [Enterococcus sp. 9E7_DIV0242]OTP15858.1 hypothetical protein A5888_002072 [Enterococcus sp. 9E7_DIV0242]